MCAAQEFLSRPAAPGCAVHGVLLAAWREAASGALPCAPSLALPTTAAGSVARGVLGLARLMRHHGRRGLHAGAPGAAATAQEKLVLALLLAPAAHRAALVPFLLRPDGQAAALACARSVRAAIAAAGESPYAGVSGTSASIALPSLMSRGDRPPASWVVSVISTRL